ncbi:hypothetical protein ABBQ38_015489 [Trebouxia sp. C0009 RCD-2024]
MAKLSEDGAFNKCDDSEPDSGSFRFRVKGGVRHDQSTQHEMQAQMEMLPCRKSLTQQCWKGGDEQFAPHNNELALTNRKTACSKGSSSLET